MPINKFTRLKNPSSWRRLSLANWKAPNDPTVYGSLEFDFKKGQEFLDKINQTSKEKITATHFVAKAIAITLRRYPDINGIVKWGRIYLRDTVDIFLQVAIPNTDESEKPDLSGTVIRECDKKSLEDIACELRLKSERIRKKEDPQFKASIGLLKVVPFFLLSFVLKIMNFVIYNLGLSFPQLGLPGDPFGSAMVTSVGMWNIPPGFPPLVPISRVPFLVCVGAINDKPRVIDSQICIRPILDMTATFDHRFMDGVTGARMLHYIREIFENPEKYL